MPAIDLLPHREPMLFVNALIERFADKAVGTAVLPASGICINNGTLLPEFFIEIIAQTTAMANGFDSQRSGRVINDGMLVGIDSFQINGCGEAGATLRVCTEKVFAFGAVKIIHGEVFAGDELLASGDIKVWENMGTGHEG